MNQNKTDKLLIDGFCRAVLLDWLNESSYFDNKNLRKYIIHEAPYKKVVSLVCSGKPLNEDASQDMKLAEYENEIANLFSLGVSLFSASTANRYIKTLINNGFKVTEKKVPTVGLFSKKPITNPMTGEVVTNVKKFANAGGKLGTPIVRALEPTVPLLTFMGIFAGAGLLAKVLFAIMRKVVSRCHKVCKQTIPKNIENYNVHLQICISKCKIQDLNKVIANLRSEAEKCKTVSANPEKCQVNIITQIGKFNAHLQDETKRLQNSLSTLDKLGGK